MAHVIFLPDAPAEAPPSVVILGPEAQHAARVKRVQVGEVLELRDGRGLEASAQVGAITMSRGEWVLEAAVTSWQRVEALKPVLRVFTGVPKGERLEEMVEGLSQTGAALWAPLETARAVVRPREAKLARLHRVAHESLKQCGRAWLLEIGVPTGLDVALGRGVIVADASGEAYEPLDQETPDTMTLLVGPEGGFEEDELERAREAGARVCRFGPHTMRIETAAVAACAVIMQRAR